MANAEDHIVKIAKALADKARIRILQGIAKRGKISCGDAEDLAFLSQPTCSHHIKILIDAGLLISEKDGRHVMITVNKAVLKEFADLVSMSVKP